MTIENRGQKSEKLADMMLHTQLNTHIYCGRYVAASKYAALIALLDDDIEEQLSESGLLKDVTGIIVFAEKGIYSPEEEIEALRVIKACLKQQDVSAGYFGKADRDFFNTAVDVALQEAASHNYRLDGDYRIIIQQPMAWLISETYKNRQPWVALEYMYHTYNRVSETLSERMIDAEVRVVADMDALSVKNMDLMILLKESAAAFAQTIKQVLTEVGRPPEMQRSGKE